MVFPDEVIAESAGCTARVMTSAGSNPPAEGVFFFGDASAVAVGMDSGLMVLLAMSSAAGVLPGRAGGKAGWLDDMPVLLVGDVSAFSCPASFGKISGGRWSLSR